MDIFTDIVFTLCCWELWMEDAIHQSGILDARMVFSGEVYGWDSVTRNLVSIENLNLKLLTVYKSLVILRCELL